MRRVRRVALSSHHRPRQLARSARVAADARLRDGRARVQTGEAWLWVSPAPGCFGCAAVGGMGRVPAAVGVAGAALLGWVRGVLAGGVGLAWYVHRGAPRVSDVKRRTAATQARALPRRAKTHCLSTAARRPCRPGSKPRSQSHPKVLCPGTLRSYQGSAHVEIGRRRFLGSGRNQRLARKQGSCRGANPPTSLVADSLPPRPAPYRPCQSGPSPEWPRPDRPPRKRTRGRAVPDP